jgi:hypothetical protein
MQPRRKKAISKYEACLIADKLLQEASATTSSVMASVGVVGGSPCVVLWGDSGSLAYTHVGRDVAC